MKGALPSAAEIMRRMGRHFRLPWKSYGKPVSREKWEEEYKAGAWRYLDSLIESDRYHIIVGYVRHFFKVADILDIGCGHGRLLTMLHPSFFKRYIGVDISDEAISQAQRLELPGVVLLKQDFEKWTPQEDVDVVVFNECLYYAHNPVALVKRCLPALRPRGKIIVSMHDAGNHNVIWRALERLLLPVHGVRLSADSGQGWTVRVFEPEAGTPLNS